MNLSYQHPKDTSLASARSASLASFVGILSVILELLFLRSFPLAWAAFANAGPLGAMVAEHSQVPEMLPGSRSDLNEIRCQTSGSRGATEVPSFEALSKPRCW